MNSSTNHTRQRQLSRDDEEQSAGKSLLIAYPSVLLPALFSCRVLFLLVSCVVNNKPIENTN